jgi:hypothetical protein
MAARGKPFEPGNKLGRGRPRGSRNKTTLMAQQLLEHHAEAIVRKCILMALQGDLQAMRLCIDRVVPHRRDLPVKLGNLPMGTPEELNKVSTVLLKRVIEGHLTPSEAMPVGQLIEGRRRMIETQDINQRLQALEASQ